MWISIVYDWVALVRKPPNEFWNLGAKKAAYIAEYIIFPFG